MTFLTPVASAAAPDWLPNGEKKKPRDPALTGRPVVVVQYPTSRHGIEDMAPDDNRVVERSASSIIAVSYEARPSEVRNGIHVLDIEWARAT